MTIFNDLTKLVCTGVKMHQNIDVLQGGGYNTLSEKSLIILFENEHNLMAGF